jgi:hypothetical protein
LIAREETRILADGLVEFLAQDWVEPEHPAAKLLGLTPDGRSILCRMDEGVVEIRMMSTSGLIDLNFAPMALLKLSFQALKISPARSHSLAAAIVDFRDSDSELTEGGAELSTYIAAGLPSGPKNSLFESIGELEQVYGISRDIFLAMRPYITVSSRASFIDLNLSPPELMFALRSVGEDSVLSGVSAHSAESLKSVRFIVSVENGRGFRIVRDATVEITKQTSIGFRMRDWSSFIEPSRLGKRPVELARNCF